ncbi:MAG TPA: inositol monophosphatase family protein [Gemmatimonadales bacterium]|nr:inositol monophosphatase family protein [Gemmatimonadales bacterium]
MDLLDLARAAADAGAGFVRQAARPAGPGAWSVKGRHDFVTEVDRGAEEVIRRILLAGEPGSAILGEELSPGDAVGPGLVWVVDPLDGTTNFLHGLPWYAVSVAAAVDGRLEAGVVVNVPAGRRAEARRGGGAWEDGHRLAVSTIDDPAFALIGTGFPFKTTETLGEYARQFAQVAAGTSGIRRPGAAALDLVDVAAARYDGFWEQWLGPWDMAAGTLIIREAGGRVTDFEGRDREIGPGPVLAGNPAMHAWLLECVRPAAE